MSSEAVLRLEEQGFFTSQYTNCGDARELFYHRFSESLLSKFISGDDIEWEGKEFERVFTVASVEQAVNELECEGLVHRFDEMVVLAEK